MGFWRRLRIYLIGVGLGCVAVYFFFKDRTFDAWLPEGRVLEQIERSTLLTSEQTNCLLQCTNTPLATLRKYITNGAVSFSKSDTRKTPCPVYHIETNYNQTPVVLMVESCRDTTTVLEINGNFSACSCQ